MLITVQKEKRLKVSHLIFMSKMKRQSPGRFDSRDFWKLARNPVFIVKEELRARNRFKTIAASRN